MAKHGDQGAGGMSAAGPPQGANRAPSGGVGAHTSAARIEEAGLNASQTQRQLFYDGWLLRVSPGKAKRARSVNAHFGSTLPLSVKIPYCERIYSERGLPALFRITPFQKPQNLESELETRAYVTFEKTLRTMTPIT